MRIRRFRVCVVDNNIILPREIYNIKSYFISSETLRTNGGTRFYSFFPTLSGKILLYRLNGKNSSRSRSTPHTAEMINAE